MRIAFLAPAHPLRGGIVQFTAILAARLIEAGHEVLVFSFTRQYPAPFFSMKRQCEPGSNPVPVPSEAVCVPYNPLTWPSAAKTISAWKPDLLLMKYWIPFFAPCFGWISRRVMAGTGCRVGYVIDNIEFHEKWLFADRLTRYALQPAGDLIVMSKAVEQIARRDFPRHRIHHREHPDYNFFAFDSTTRETARERFRLGDDPTLLFFGYIKAYKGLDLLLEAMPLALREIPSLKLLVGGEVYGSPRIYEDLLDRHGLRSAVRWNARFIANDEVAGFFRAADLAVLPYRSATQSGVTKAAFAFDLPVIATDVGGLGEVIRDGINGYLVPPDNPAALAAAIVRYFREERSGEFRRAIREDRPGDSWKPFVDTVLTMAEKR